MLSISAMDIPLSSTWVRPLLRGLRLRLVMPNSGPFPFRCMSDGERPPIGPSCQGRTPCGSPRCRGESRVVRGSPQIDGVRGKRCVVRRARAPTRARIAGGSDMKGGVAAAVALLATIGIARAQTHIALDELVGSWQADQDVQYVELRMLADGENAIGNVAALVFDDATASADGRRALLFTANVSRGVAGAKILVATTK